ncbi:MAG: tRNA pseudouridine(13) synthase TruD [Deinococcota bacterium]
MTESSNTSAHLDLSDETSSDNGTSLEDASMVEPQEALRFSWQDLPRVSESLDGLNLPGTGGRIRSELDDFQVDELPLYEPQGSGSFLYVHVEKRGLTSSDLVKALKQAGVPEKRIGMAGLKDKYAIARQWLSIPNAQAEALTALETLEGVRILETSRHKNKLGIGHLRGNHFQVRVRGVSTDAVDHARDVLDHLATYGLPNYFGPQRFGRFGNNAIDGFKVARRQEVPGGKRLARFFVASLQSFVFNQLLAERIRAGLYDSVVTGDWAKKHYTGGTFLVEDGELESPRAKRLEISSALPLFGKKVRPSGGDAGVLEQAVLTRYDLRWTDGTMLRGDRRLSRVVLTETSVMPCEDGYIVAFTLPKGSFATSVLREVLDVAVDAPTERPRQSDTEDSA